MRVACINVATGPYLNYWLRLLPEIDEFFFPGHDVTVHLFTDQVSLASEVRSARARVSVHQVPALRWPEATLFRYELIASIAPKLFPLDVVAYLDVDMKIVAPVGPELDPLTWPNGLAMTRHPGFFRPSGLKGLLNRLRRPRQFLLDLRGRPPGQRVLGTWETDPVSLAYVPVDDRTTYVMGAFWLGTGVAISQMARELAADVRRDYENGVIAVWHDESHLNAFAARHAVAYLSPAYLHIPNAWQLDGIQPIIECLDKGDHDFHS